MPTKKRGEELLRRAERLLGPAPDARPADLFARALEAEHGPLGMLLALGPADFAVDPQPVPDRRHGAEGHPGLRHPQGPGFMPTKSTSAAAAAVPFEIPRVRLPRVLQRIVDMGHRRREGQGCELGGEVVGNLDQAH